MNSSKGYYCLIQYCPDLSRAEAANVGVLLFCPERNFLRARTASGNDRIGRFFGRAGQDWERVNAMKAAIEDRLGVEAKFVRTCEDLERFIATRANEIQITPPRPMRISDPSKDLASLFDRLVGGRARRAPKGHLVARLARQFRDAGVEHLVERDVQVDVPLFKRTLTVPFGFQNGCYNLIQPVRFAGVSRVMTEERACRLATEGRSLRQQPATLRGSLRLVVVGEFPAIKWEEGDVVRSIFQDSDVPFHALEGMDALVDEIRSTARPSSGQR